jgi:hypothetical protein
LGLGPLDSGVKNLFDRTIAEDIFEDSLAVLRRAVCDPTFSRAHKRLRVLIEAHDE